MIRMYASTSAGQCKSYYTDSLQPTSYFINEQELQGNVYGRISDRLGITGIIDKETYGALCDNLHPVTGQNLTPHTKDHRTVAYDISYFAPKSVSLAYMLLDDERILQKFRESVRSTMLEMENDMMTRVRKKGKDEDRHTGEMVISEFIHLTARPSDGGVSDPLMHAHNTVHNVTFDKIENCYKAGQFREINRSMPYYQQRFHKRLADSLLKLGYKIRKTKSAFEIEGIPAPIIELMSKRSNEIGKFAKEHGITDIKALDQLGAKTRNKKQKDISLVELKVEWQKQIKEASKGKDDWDANIVRHKEKIISPDLAPERCVDHAALHTFERLSTIDERRLLETAYRYAVGNNSVSLDEITNSYNNDSRFLRVKQGYQTICTTKEVLAEEKEMIALARNGQGRFKPFYNVLPEIKLDGQQRNAIETVLSTTNLVSIIRGTAGSGKTTTLIELDRHLKNIGIEAQYTAPTGKAVKDVLIKEGFTNAVTVARLLVDKDLQDNLQNKALIMDEGGLIGTTMMRDVLKLASEKNARLIVLGDEKQHSSVERGDSLKNLRIFGKIKPAEITKIRRQKNEKYRGAVQDLADGNIKAAFGKLADIDAIRQIDPLNPNAELASDYVATIKRRKSALIVSPTHEQGQSVTNEVRERLKDEKLLGKKDYETLKLKSLNLTEAQKRDWRNFRPGQVIQFNLPAPQIKRGSVWSIDAVIQDRVIIKDKIGLSRVLPLDKAKAFDIYESVKINLAKGDKIRITKNGFDKNKKRLDNGQSFEVVSFNKSEIKVRNRESKTNYSLNHEFGHIDHDYCTTSHSSQGRTVDEVFISQPAGTFPATDSKQIYVSVSRGRHMVTIYTDDKEQLLEYAERTGDRQSALELISNARQGRNFKPERYQKIVPEKSVIQSENKTTTQKRRVLEYEP